MGWNSGYAALEKAIISVYNTGNLSPIALDEIVKPYKGTDCDSGGSEDLKANDGLMVDQIICKVLCPIQFDRIVRAFKANDEYDDFIEYWKNNDDAWNLYSKVWYGYWQMW